MSREKKPQKYEIRPVPLWGALLCGLFVIGVGLYQCAANKSVSGLGESKYSRRGNSIIVLTGMSTIAIGIMICIPPAYLLIKKKI
jgi:hypothetical protein